MVFFGKVRTVIFVENKNDMKATELLRYILEVNPEWKWNDDDVFVWIPFYELQDFYNLIKGSGNLLDEGGIQCQLIPNYICFEMKQICDHYGIELEDVFPKKDND